MSGRSRFLLPSWLGKWKRGKCSAIPTKSSSGREIYIYTTYPAWKVRFEPEVNGKPRENLRNSLKQIYFIRIFLLERACTLLLRHYISFLYVRQEVTHFESGRYQVEPCRFDSVTSKCRYGITRKFTAASSRVIQSAVLLCDAISLTSRTYSPLSYLLHIPALLRTFCRWYILAHKGYYKAQARTAKGSSPKEYSWSCPKTRLSQHTGMTLWYCGKLTSSFTSSIADKC